MLAEIDRARDALHACDPSCSRDEWVKLAMASKAAGIDLDTFDGWSAQAENYSERDARAVWNSIRRHDGIGPGTLFKMAAQAGWTPQGRTVSQSPRKAPQRTVEAPKRPRPGQSAPEVWGRCNPAPADHGYILAKQGLPDGLRVVPEGNPLVIAGQSMAGALVVPVLPLAGGEPASLQFIGTPEQAAAWKAADRPSKLNLPGAPMAGVFIVGELQAGGTAFIVEGIGQGWACWKATGQPAVVCFGAGRFCTVAHELRQRDPAASLVLVPDRGKEEQAEAIAREVTGRVVMMPEDAPLNFDANDYAAEHGTDGLESLLAGAAEPAKPALPFSLVPIADIGKTDPPPPAWVWRGLIPAGHVTLLAAHGGTGKSTLALMLCVAVALGLALFGIPTRRGKVAFYSGEDAAALLRYRLRLVCRCMGVNVEDLAGRVFILDATDHDPTLFAEVATAGRREGVTTDTFERLREFLAAEDVSLLVVDNASDTFDASEIDRARVRGFMRALARIARERDAGVLLLAHVDKGTSRGDRGANSEGYSGSTAWNNGPRSRMFMSRDKDGALLLEHQKCNLAKLREPLRLVWPADGIPELDAPFGPVVQGIADRGNTKALLKLIAEFTQRGEFVSTAVTARAHAAKLLSREATYPKLKDAEVFDLLRKAERDGQIERVQFKGADRHQRERWEVTPQGAAFAGIRVAGTAGTAGTAATTEVPAPPAQAAESAGTAGTCRIGGVGETAPHEVAAQAPAGGGDAL